VARGLQIMARSKTPMETSRILVATDFSDASERAVAYASDLAFALNSDLCILHVVSPVGRPNWAARVKNDDADSLTELLVRDAGAVLGHVVARVADTLPTVRGAVRIGLEAEEILNFARENHVSLIIVGMHGQGMAARLLLGSVTDRILRKSICPVLAIPSPAYDPAQVAQELPRQASRLVS
jgi:nucleotide-binding universal stress UspA family protein